MSPVDTLAAARDTSFPRTRGDEPGWRWPTIVLTVFSPHTRG